MTSHDCVVGMSKCFLAQCVRSQAPECILMVKGTVSVFLDIKDGCGCSPGYTRERTVEVREASVMSS